MSRVCKMRARHTVTRAVLHESNTLNTSIYFLMGRKTHQYSCNKFLFYYKIPLLFLENLFKSAHMGLTLIYGDMRISATTISHLTPRQNDKVP